MTEMIKFKYKCGIINIYIYNVYNWHNILSKFIIKHLN